MLHLSPGVRRQWAEAREMCETTPNWPKMTRKQQHEAVVELAKILAVGEQGTRLARCFRRRTKIEIEIKP